MINIIQIIIPLIHSKIQITKMISKKDKMKLLGYMKDILLIKILKINDFIIDFEYQNIYNYIYNKFL
jgi:hypothetical protein